MVITIANNSFFKSTGQSPIQFYVEIDHVFFHTTVVNFFKDPAYRSFKKDIFYNLKKIDATTIFLPISYLRINIVKKYTKEIVIGRNNNRKKNEFGNMIIFYESNVLQKDPRKSLRQSLFKLHTDGVISEEVRYQS